LGERGRKNAFEASKEQSPWKTSPVTTPPRTAITSGVDAAHTTMKAEDNLLRKKKKENMKSMLNNSHIIITNA